MSSRRSWAEVDWWRGARRDWAAALVIGLPPALEVVMEVPSRALEAV